MTSGQAITESAIANSQALRLSGRTVVITNATASIGAALVGFLLSHGANVVANCRVAESTRERFNGRLLHNFAKSSPANTLIEAAAAEFGGVDILVNIAHLPHDPLFSDSTDAGWQFVLESPLKTAYKSSQAAWSHFKTRGSGRIVNVCLPIGGANVHYSALKHSLYGLTKTSALEGKKHDIAAYLLTSTTPTLLHAEDDSQLAALAPGSDAIVRAIVALGLLKGTSDTGSLFEISGSRIAKLRWMRSRGALLVPDETFTPSAVLKRWQDIIETSNATCPTGPVDVATALADISKIDSNPSAEPVSFVGQVVVVTGAGAGLGRAHALQFAKLGAMVVVNDLQNAEVVVEEIRAHGGKAIASSESAVEGSKIIAMAIETFGRVDVVVNNAGFLRDKTLAKMEESLWDAVVNVHLNGMYQVVKAAWPYFLRQGGGRVVNTTSTSGLYGFFGQCNYSAAKAGIVGLADALAREGAKHSIIVNTIAPIAATAGLAANIASIPGGDPNPLRPDYISPLVALLGSSQAQRLSNGGVFELAGGWHSRTVLQRSAGSGVGLTLDDSLAVWPQVVSFDRSLDRSTRRREELLETIEKLKATEVERLTYNYDQMDIILYNLSVGAKKSDLDLVYENSPAFQPVPTFGLIPALEPSLIYNNANLVPDFSDRRALHGEHYLEILKHPIPLSGTLKTSATVLDVVDKGNAAITITGLVTRDAGTDEAIFYNEATFFLRGSGSFGGPPTRQSPLRPPALSSPPPDRPADVSITHKTSEEQAALYRLTGDRVALHIDPEFSAAAGFSQPILHGACFLGITGYHILRTYGAYRSLRIRFAGIVIPGQTLRVEMWRGVHKDANLVFFQTSVVETGALCVQGGVAVLLLPGQKL